MNVIIVNDYAYVNGGASQIALHTAKSLAYAGCDVYLFSAVGPVDESLKNIKRLNVICLHQSDILSNPSRLQAIVQGLWNKKASDAMYAFSSLQLLSRLLIAPSQCLQSLEQCA
ncbi:hypothetical protein LIQ52_11050 [Mitsuokella jalaludinii]|uniref:hypothetical protein n=1 Tax=Mitsuokella jalaludinii TaxID=187979 RepID=UPI001D02DF6D|nr:hypothetical protein [Mitsuokella jalaludinii]MCB5725847.1 hypothetical protein [Mitsuokella jalaludinii]